MPNGASVHFRFDAPEFCRLRHLSLRNARGKNEEEEEKEEEVVEEGAYMASHLFSFVT